LLTADQISEPRIDKIHHVTVNAFMRDTSYQRLLLWNDFGHFEVFDPVAITKYLAKLLSSRNYALMSNSLLMFEKTIFLIADARALWWLYNNVIEVRLRETTMYLNIGLSKLVVSTRDPNKTFSDVLTNLQVSTTTYSFTTSIPNRLSRVQASLRLKEMALTSLLPIKLEWQFPIDPIFDPLELAGCILTKIFFPGYIFDVNTRRQISHIIYRFGFNRNQGRYTALVNQVGRTLSLDGFKTFTVYDLVDKRSEIEFGRDAFGVFNNAISSKESFVSILFGKNTGGLTFFGGMLNGNWASKTNPLVLTDAFNDLNVYIERLKAEIQFRSRLDRRKLDATIGILNMVVDNSHNLNAALTNLNMDLWKLAHSAFMRYSEVIVTNAATMNLYAQAVDTSRSDADRSVSFQELDTMVNERLISLRRPYDPITAVGICTTIQEQEFQSLELDLDYHLEGYNLSYDMDLATVKLKMHNDLVQMFRIRNTTRSQRVKEAFGGSAYFSKVMTEEDVSRRARIISSESAAWINNMTSFPQYLHQDAVDMITYVTPMLQDKIDLPPLSARPMLYMLMEPGNNIISANRGTHTITFPGLQISWDDIRTIPPNDALDFFNRYVNAENKEDEEELDFIPFLPYLTVENMLIHDLGALLSLRRFVVGPFPYEFKEVSFSDFSFIQENNTFKIDPLRSTSAVYSKVQIPFVRYTTGESEYVLLRLHHDGYGTAHPIISDEILNYWFPETTDVLKPKVSTTFSQEFEYIEMDNMFVVQARE
jgi:hypothetical protein